MSAANEKIIRMVQPEELNKNEPLKWSPGTGTEVWEMFCAAITGDLETIQRLVGKNEALARCQYHYRKPLYFAVRENQVEVAAFLLKYDPDPFGLVVGDSLFEIAQCRGYREMEDLLNSFRKEAYGSSPKGNAVAAAIRERNLEKVKQILDASPELLHEGDETSNQPIHWAVMSRQPDIIDELLSRGADINAKRADKARPLHLFNGDYHYRGWRDVPRENTPSPLEVLNHVIARGAYVDINTAAHMGNIERVKELLDEDPSLANRVSDNVTYYLGSGTPLNNAAARGHIEIVKLLLEYGADPNLPEEGIAPQGKALYSAVSGGYYEIAKFLLEKGAYPSPQVESSADALSIALLNKDEKMAELLCSYGSHRSINIMAYYNDIRTIAAVFAVNPALADDPDALSSAIEEKNGNVARLILCYQPDLPKRTFLTGGKTREITDLLFAHGMNPNQKDWLGGTPLHQSARNGDVEKAAIFIKRGADLNAREEDISSTPLAWAAKFGKAVMVEFLLRCGAKPNLPDDPPWATPRAWAERRGHQQIVDMLNRYERDGSVCVFYTKEIIVALVDDLMLACNQGNLEAIHRVQAHYQFEKSFPGEEIRKHIKERLGIAANTQTETSELLPEEAQLFIARSHGYESWSELMEKV